MLKYAVLMGGLDNTHLKGGHFMSQYSVPLKKIVEDLDLTVVRKSSDFDTKQIVSTSVDRPALKLAGI